MLNKVFITSLLAVSVFSFTAKANICSSFFEGKTKKIGPNLFELAKNSDPLQQEFNVLGTATEQLQFIKDKIQEGYFLVEVEVGKHKRVAPPTPYSGGVDFLIEYRYYLFDSIENAQVIVDMTNNQFVHKDNYGHAIKVNFKNSSQVLNYFSGERRNITWTPDNLNFASRMKLNISSYPTSGFWKIDNAPGFQDYAIGNFYLRVYRDSKANLKPVVNEYKLRKLNLEF